MSSTYAVDASSVIHPAATGIGHYTRSLVMALDEIAGSIASAPRIALLYRSGFWRQRGRIPTGPQLDRQIWHKTLIPRAPAYAAVLCPEFRMPGWPGVPRVGVIHDIHPVLGLNNQDEAQRLRSVADLRRYVAHAQRLIFVSEHTRSEFLAHFDFPGERGAVIHHGVGRQFRLHDVDEIASIRARLGLQRPFCLWAGSARPSKNLDHLLPAFARTAAARGHELVLAGHVSEEQRGALSRIIAGCGLDGRTRMLGYVAEADIPPLFAAADAYLFPSLHEGFGMPILEAMASGTPVLTSNTTACPEAAAGHAILVDPTSIDDIARGIAEALQMDRNRIEAARDHAARQTWTECARRTLQVLQDAAQSG